MSLPVQVTQYVMDWATKATVSSRLWRPGYVRALLARGANLEFFIEGGRSRDGRIGAPRLGLLALVVDAALDAPLARVRE